jgi:hypothetical protein
MPSVVTKVGSSGLAGADIPVGRAHHGPSLAQGAVAAASGGDVKAAAMSAAETTAARVVRGMDPPLRIVRRQRRRL